VSSRPFFSVASKLGPGADVYNGGFVRYAPGLVTQQNRGGAFQQRAIIPQVGSITLSPANLDEPD
jgi:hypothetical protein